MTANIVKNTVSECRPGYFGFLLPFWRETVSAQRKKCMRKEEKLCAHRVVKRCFSIQKASHVFCGRFLKR